MAAKARTHYDQSRMRQLYEHSGQKNTVRQKVDTPLMLLILMLVATGLIALFTASYSNAYYYKGDALWYIRRQAVFAVAGLGVMWAASNVNYRVYAGFVKMIFGVSMIFMILTPFIGFSEKGATRWLGVGSISFQPSEVMKIAVIIAFSWYASRPDAHVEKLPRLAPYMLSLVAIAFCLKLQNHLSAAMITFGIAFVILLVAGMRVRYVVIAGVAVAAAAIAYIQTNPYAMARIMVWQHPFDDFKGDGWQGAMSQIAIGSGGLFGQGLGQGRQKHLFLPEPQNDFVFSNWCEELGLIGALLVLLMFAYLIFRGFYVARGAKDKFGCLLASGIIGKFAIQTLMNLFVITGLMPITGASLPFFSYGGTALLMQMFEMGILLNISRHMVQETTE